MIHPDISRCSCSYIQNHMTEGVTIYCESYITRLTWYVMIYHYIIHKSWCIFSESCIVLCHDVWNVYTCIIYIHTYIPTYLHTYIPTYLHTYIPTYLHTYIPTYLHTYIPTYLHTYIHTHIPYAHHPSACSCWTCFGLEAHEFQVEAQHCDS